ncbi:MAG: diacylglycerol kinase family protein [Candidatus Eisenbacteria bacterium]
MRYGIIVNPAAGEIQVDEKRNIVERCASILGIGTLTAGWDAGTAGELCDCAAEMADRVDVLVVAGGDGTLSDVINTIDGQTVLAYLPLGSGNAWRNTLGLPRSLEKVAERIRDGKIRLIDLVLCDETRKGLLASVGIEGHALSEREKLLEQGVTGFDAYFRATTKSLFGGFKGEDADLTIDGEPHKLVTALSLVVTKTPFYGYGFKVVPGAKLTDGHLHLLLVSGDPSAAISGLVTSLLGGNRVGLYTTCKEVSLRTRQELHLQVDGNLVREGTDFSFRILPTALQMKY